MKADETGARDAILGLSEVIADASGSSGSGPLTFSLDYGDGFVATSSTGHHTYTAAGTYTVTVTVTDGQARKATGSRQITVRRSPDPGLKLSTSTNRKESKYAG